MRTSSFTAQGNDVVTLGTGTDNVAFDGGTNTVNAVIGATGTPFMPRPRASSGV